MSIIELARFRKPKKYEEVHKKEDRLECMVCHSDLFRVWASGDVSCSSCGAKMSNLHVYRYPT